MSLTEPYGTGQTPTRRQNKDADDDTDGNCDDTDFEIEQDRYRGVENATCKCSAQAIEERAPERDRRRFLLAGLDSLGAHRADYLPGCMKVTGTYRLLTNHATLRVGIFRRQRLGVLELQVLRGRRLPEIRHDEV